MPNHSPSTSIDPTAVSLTGQQPNPHDGGGLPSQGHESTPGAWADELHDADPHVELRPKDEKTSAVKQDKSNQGDGPHDDSAGFENPDRDGQGAVSGPPMGN